MERVFLHRLAVCALFAAMMPLTSCLRPIECYTLSVIADNPAGGSVTGAGQYPEDAIATLEAIPNSGYTFIRWLDGIADNPRQVAVNGDATYTAIFLSDGSAPITDTSGIQAFDTNGASLSQFSVSSTKKIRFSRGNLQYNAATNTWRFAEHQYDRIGQGNTQISAMYDGWIDLFAWATSGWNSGAVAYQPWSTSTNDADYYPGGNWNQNLTGTYAEADWAWHNPISNGGNRAHMWRLPTADEWRYLIKDRPGAASKIAMSTVNNQHGLIILPDNWTTPTGLTFNAGMGGGWIWNTYNLAQWEKMETAGAIFLPTTGGRRDGTTVVEEDVTGFYISSTIYSSEKYRHLSFSPMWYYAPGEGTIHEGQGIRPILD